MFPLRVDRIDIWGVSTAGAPGAVSRSVACAPKRRVANCFAAAGIVDGVVGEAEEAQVG